MSHQHYGKHDENGRLMQPDDYSDGRTKQAFKDESDINKIMHRAQAAGTISHLQKYEPVYGDFADFDLLEAKLKLQQADEVFGQLPSELRNEFRNDPAAFFTFVNDPRNQPDLATKLPALAKPGRQNIDVSGKTPPIVAGMAPSGAASEPQANENKAAAPPTGEESKIHYRAS